jgi:hypothetical protein
MQELNSAQQPRFDGQVAWVIILSFTPGALLQFSGGEKHALTSRVGSYRAPLGRPWSRLTLSGTVVVLIGEPGDPFPGMSQSGALDAAGDAVVVGPEAEGAVSATNPLQVAGQDGTGHVRTILTDAAGTVVVVGPETAGVAASPHPLTVGGKDDGGLSRILLTDTSGRLISVGAAASGQAVSGLPVLIAGADAGALTRILSTDTAGRQIAVGAAPSGSDPVGSPVQVGGVDVGGLVQPILIDTFGRQAVGIARDSGNGDHYLACTYAGRLILDGAQSAGTAPAGSSFLIGGIDSEGIIRNLLVDSSGRLQGMGNNPRPSFCQQFVLGGVAAVLACIEAPNITLVRIRRIVIYQCGYQAAAGMRSLELDRTTTAGGSGPVTPNALTAIGYSGVCRVGNSGTIGAPLLALGLFVPGALGPFHPIEVYNSSDLHAEPIVIPVGVANGVALRDLTGGTGGAQASGAIFFDMET